MFHHTTQIKLKSTCGTEQFDNVVAFKNRDIITSDLNFEVILNIIPSKQIFTQTIELMSRITITSNWCQNFVQRRFTLQPKHGSRISSANSAKMKGVKNQQRLTVKSRRTKAYMLSYVYFSPLTFADFLRLSSSHCLRNLFVSHASAVEWICAERNFDTNFDTIVPILYPKTVTGVKVRVRTRVRSVQKNAWRR